MTEAFDCLQQELFLRVFAVAPNGMAILSAEGTWLRANQSLCQSLGYSEAELQCMSARDIVHPDDLPAVGDIWKELADGPLADCRTESRYMRKDGSLLHAEAVLSAIRDERGGLVFFIFQLQELTAMDIAEQGLKAKTQQLESFIEHNADAIWIVDETDTIVEVNPAFETLFGWPAEEVVGGKLPIVPDFLQNSMNRIHERIRQGETIAGLETTRLCKDGQLIDVEATLSPLRDHNGAVIGITGICRDTTRRKHAEQELKAKTQQLESFIEHNADAMWIVDAADTIVEVNPSFETLFGWPAEEVAGGKLPIIPDFLKHAMQGIHDRIRQGETIVGLETTRQCKDGRLLDVEATLSPLRDYNGAIIGITGICRDTTRRKRAERALLAKTQQLESFIDHNADAILIFNNEAVVERVNAAFERVFGWAKEDIVGVELHRLPFLPADYMSEVNRIYTQITKGEPIVGHHTVRQHRNGDRLHVVLTASPILDDQGNKSGWSVSMRDVTAWKIAQEHLQNSEKLSVAGQLAAGIAHEIRNPITVIKGFIQLMKSGFDDKQKYYEIIASEIERIELIVGELLILAKPQVIKYERKDIRVLLTQVMALLDSQAILSNVQFSTVFKPGCAFLYCDENQLKQVFINFIKNSIESMPGGGKIEVEVDCHSDREILIRLADQGCGIPPDVLAKLGQPFYTTKEKGTGLGFMVSKKIIENHLGGVRVQSEVGKGTTIEITLPVSAKPHIAGALVSRIP
jgi:PAS domain S-box-containing protein